MGRIWEEVLLTYFKALSQNLPGGIDANHKPSVRIAGLWAKNQTCDL